MTPLGLLSWRVAHCLQDVCENEDSNSGMEGGTDEGTEGEDCGVDGFSRGGK